MASNVVAKPLYQDPFAPVLHNSKTLTLSEEQQYFIKEVLDVACSDSRFSAKAYLAILGILAGGTSAAPALSGLSPSSVVLGQPSFDIHVNGTGFNTESVIVFNGFEEPTTFISSTELTTGINMPLWQAPAEVPVLVQNADGTSSQPMTFSFTAAAGTFSAREVPEKTHGKPIEQGKIVEVVKEHHHEVKDKK